MTRTYDLQQNVAHTRLRVKRAEVETLRISDELNTDLAPDETVYGSDLPTVPLRLLTAKTTHEKTMLQRQIAATDHQIDQLVYDLYGLTDEEIKIVEEATTRA